MENEENTVPEFPDIPDPDPPESEPRLPGDFTQTAAVQAVICCLIAAALLILGGIEPETGSAVFSRLKELAAEDHALIPDPVGLLIGLCGK